MIHNIQKRPVYCQSNCFREFRRTGNEFESDLALKTPREAGRLNQSSSFSTILRDLPFGSGFSGFSAFAVF